MTVRVCINGDVLAPEEAKVSVFDRGFLYGDSVFEVMRTYSGKCFAEHEHLERLARSAELVLISMPASLETLSEEIRRTLAAASNDESYVRVVVTRGQGPLTLDPGKARDPLRVIIVSPLPVPPPELYTEGISACLVLSSRPTDYTRAAGAKASNYLANLLAAEEARRKGGQEAILTDSSGEILEGATSNVFVVRGGEVRTPPLELGILGGITRAAVLSSAARIGIAIREDSLFPNDLYDAEEVFLTSSIREVAPVVRVDGRPIGDGRPGPITRALHAAFLEDLRASLGIGPA
ncbi:MAG: aminotransferase class IV [Polyangiaceae bacterium]|nr:aminotransferase class IV [Polyangiaceae bacterium]